MPWTNYHSHTYYCDGSDEPELYIKSAIQKGLKAYGFSSHAPVSFNTDWCVANNALSNYMDDIIALKRTYCDELEIYQGLEIDFIPGVAGRRKHILKSLDLDFFISSVHFVDQFSWGEPWNIDHNKELFKKGIQKIFAGSFQRASNRFYEITRQMLTEESPDILGHLDKIKMYNSEEQFFKESEKWYRDQVEETLDVIKKSGTIVEINTRGYYRYNQLDLYPSEWIIEKLATMDIPVMLNSDAHHPNELISGFEYAVEKLKKAGVKRLWALVRGKWSGYEYSAEGLHL